jgi:hypothetical protein
MGGGDKLRVIIHIYIYVNIYSSCIRIYIIWDGIMGWNGMVLGLGQESDTACFVGHECVSVQTWIRHMAPWP